MKPYSSQIYGPIETEYRLGITTSKNLIDQQRNSMRIKPGNHMKISVLPRLVETTTYFNDLRKDQRKCKLPHETEGFAFLKEYSRIGCEIECAAQNAISICKCLPWYYPNHFKEWPICDMFGGFCFDLIMSDNTYYKKCIAECLVDCEETTYMVFSDNMPLDLDATCNQQSFHYQHFQKNFDSYFAQYSYKSLMEGGSIDDVERSLTNGSLCRDYVRDYVAFVSVESPISQIILTSKDRRIFFYDLLGKVGMASHGLDCDPLVWG